MVSRDAWDTEARRAKIYREWQDWRGDAESARFCFILFFMLLGWLRTGSLRSHSFRRKSATGSQSPKSRFQYKMDKVYLTYTTEGIHTKDIKVRLGKGEYSTRTVGSLYTKDFKVYLGKDSVRSSFKTRIDLGVLLEDGKGNAMSFFHDVPLYAQEGEKNILNMVVEIPRWTNAKLEISKEEMLNPIHQDVSKGKVRFVKNVFPFYGYIWNVSTNFPTALQTRHI